MVIPNEKIERYISPFHVGEERQNKVFLEIRENAKGDFDFFVLTVFSAIIITLGLVVDSSAVIIGGMLLAPLFWPILALSLAIVKGRSGLLQESVFVLLKSSFIILIIAIFLGFLSPDYALKGSEFISRTSPTIFELFIALAAGFVGAFIISYPKIGAAIAGVVIAAALVPPVAVMGISISHGNLGMSGGSFLLYLSNLIAVTFSASSLFLISKFKGPSTEQGQEKRKSNIRWTLVFLIIMAIPLLFITNKAIKEKNNQNLIREIVSARFSMSVIENVEIEEKNEIMLVNITIQHPKPESITENQIGFLAYSLSQEMKKTVIPRIKVIPVIEL